MQNKAVWIKPKMSFVAFGADEYVSTCCVGSGTNIAGIFIPEGNALLDGGITYLELNRIFRDEPQQLGYDNKSWYHDAAKNHGVYWFRHGNQSCNHHTSGTLMNGVWIEENKFSEWETQQRLFNHNANVVGRYDGFDWNTSEWNTVYYDASQGINVNGMASTDQYQCYTGGGLIFQGGSRNWS